MLCGPEYYANLTICSIGRDTDVKSPATETGVVYPLHWRVMEGIAAFMICSELVHFEIKHRCMCICPLTPKMLVQS